MLRSTQLLLGTYKFSCHFRCIFNKIKDVTVFKNPSKMSHSFHFKYDYLYKCLKDGVCKKAK